MRFRINNIVFNVILALFLTYGTIIIIPKEFFSKYTLRTVHERNLSENIKYYYLDLENDGDIFHIQYNRGDDLGRVFQIQKNDIFIDNFNLPAGEFSVGLNLVSADNNKNRHKEFYFVSANENYAFLNILEFNQHAIPKLSHKKIVLDSVFLYNNAPDVVCYFMDCTDDNNIVLSLQSGYSIQPRKIYVYNINNDYLSKGPINSIATYGYKTIHFDSKNYFLPVNIYASDNTISIRSLQKYATSQNQDTIALYYEYKNKAYKYGDFAAYTLLYNDSLTFEFPPVEYSGWTCRAISNYLLIDNQLFIVSLIGKSNDETRTNVLNLVNLNGVIVKTTPFPGGKWRFLENGDNDKIYLKKGNILKVLNQNLEPLKEIKFDDNVQIIGFEDLNADGKPELLTLFSNKLKVYGVNFKLENSLLLNSYNTEQHSFSVFETFKVANETLFNLEAGDISLILKYEFNKKYYFKYLFYFIIFGLWNFVFWLLIKLNSKRLEAEKKKLEQIVEERTKDLSKSNRILLNQKNEIDSQARALLAANYHLKELNVFKETMTNTVVHDLKNPLNLIINLSDNRRIRQSAERMLNLVMNILDIQKYENKKMILNMEMVLLSEVVNEAADRVDFLLNQKNIKIIETYDSCIEISVDKSSITRVFVNLLTNAIKFSPFNSEIIIAAICRDDEQIIMRVLDKGVGVSDSKKVSIFDKFEQVDSCDSGSVKSSGLGLTFCKLAIEAHKGEIRVENNEYGGASFVFNLKGKLSNGKKPDFKKQRTEEYFFSDDELEIIKPVIEKLKAIPVYNASDILHLLSSLGSENKKISMWSDSIKNTVFTGNSILYSKLTNLKK